MPTLQNKGNLTCHSPLHQYCLLEDHGTPTFKLIIWCLELFLSASSSSFIDFQNWLDIIQFIIIDFQIIGHKVMDREAWHATIHGVTESQTRLSDWTELMIHSPAISFSFYGFEDPQLFLYSPSGNLCGSDLTDTTSLLTTSECTSSTVISLMCSRHIFPSFGEHLHLTVHMNLT